MKNILFYYPSNKRAVVNETLLRFLKNKGHNVFFLTTCEEGLLHEEIKKAGINVTTHAISKKSSLLYYFNQILFLISFCRKNKIDLLISSLQHVNFISVFAQYFIKSRVVLIRHHFKFDVYSEDLKLVYNKTEAFFDKIINRLAKEMVVPSNGVYQGILKYENVKENKLKILPYFYDFSMYEIPDENAVDTIKQKYHSRLLLIMCSRLIPFKRHQIVFEAVNDLIKSQQLDIKLIVLDDGELKTDLENYISENNLSNSIFMLGFKTDFINYMAAADLLVHPSLTEASNSTTKEMGLLRKGVAVCKNVGDFDDYIINNQNGYLMETTHTKQEIEKVIIDAYHNEAKLVRFGDNLHNTVLEKFSIESSSTKLYEAYFNI
jgi:glycosyltransferase involved in cell wall biosynthesis